MVDEIEKETEPLWLPKGSIRAILVLVALFSSLALLVKGYIVPEWFISLVIMSFGFYFGTRSQA